MMIAITNSITSSSNSSFMMHSAPAAASVALPCSVISSSSISTYETDDDDEQQYNHHESIMDHDDDHQYYHHKEHDGVDENFLNELFLIAENDQGLAIHQDMNDGNDFQLTAYEYHDDNDAIMIEDIDSEDDDEIINSSSLSNSCIIPQHVSSSSSASSSLSPPCATFDSGMVNAFFVVDPIKNIVFFPKQTLSCQIDNDGRIETIECGPIFLPTFDANVMQEFNHVVMTMK